VSVETGGILIIRRGTVLKFSQNSGLFVSGALEAQSASDHPVYFTAWRDDAVGGDANHDGQASAPAAGWWRGVQVNGRRVGAIGVVRCSLSRGRRTQPPDSWALTSNLKLRARQEPGGAWTARIGGRAEAR
jgi:hypothetical protein